MNLRTIFRSTCISLLLATFNGMGALASGTIEVVQSVPLETTLALPGIRETQTVWLEMIQSAQTSIDIEQFYVSDQAGESLEPVLLAIEQAAKERGVRVRLLADIKFFSNYPDSIKKFSQIKNCETKLIDFSGTDGVQHAKFFIVDGKQSFVGSQNFDWRAISHIHEVGLRVTDPKVNADLQRIFEKDWTAGNTVSKYLTFPFSQESGATSDIYVAASPAKLNPANIPDSLTEILNLMKSAQKSIRIQVMEYTTKVYGNGQKPWKELDNAIRAAAARGVQVQLLIDSSKVKNAKKDLQGLAALKNIEVRSAKIPAFSGGNIPYARMIHSKYLIIDNTASWVGSENWSKGYFMNSRDVGLVVQSQPATEQLTQIFNQIWTSHYVSRITAQ